MDRATLDWLVVECGGVLVSQADKADRQLSEKQLLDAIETQRLDQ